MSAPDRQQHSDIRCQRVCRRIPTLVERHPSGMPLPSFIAKDILPFAIKLVALSSTIVGYLSAGTTNEMEFVPRRALAPPNSATSAAVLAI